MSHKFGDVPKVTQVVSDRTRNRNQDLADSISISVHQDRIFLGDEGNIPFIY